MNFMTCLHLSFVRPSNLIRYRSCLVKTLNGDEDTLLR